MTEVWIASCPQMGSDNIVEVYSYSPSDAEIEALEEECGYGEDSIEIEQYVVREVE